ncbi:hypothetical protein GCM10020220_051080 [Nonomuraea rubra]
MEKKKKKQQKTKEAVAWSRRVVGKTVRGHGAAASGGVCKDSRSRRNNTRSVVAANEAAPAARVTAVMVYHPGSKRGCDD